MGFWASLGEWVAGSDAPRRNHTSRHNGRQPMANRSRGYEQAHGNARARTNARDRIATRSTSPRGDLQRNKSGLDIASAWFNRPERSDARGYRHSDAT